MRLISTCAAALLGMAIGDIAQLGLFQMILVSAGGALVTFRARSAGAVLMGFALGAIRTLAPALSLPFDLPDTFAPWREGARSSIGAYMPDPQASLASGVLLGGSGHLDATFKLELQRSGLSHLVAIDGFKEVIVAGAVVWLLRGILGRRIALIASLTTVAVYVAITGAHPSTLRAALMVALATVAGITGRLPDSLTSLLLAVVGMALIDPRVLLDLGLELSFSATLGIILIWPRLRRVRRVQGLPRWIREPVGLTVVVTVACLPVTLSAFRVVSLISPVAHIIAVPLLPLVLVSAAALAISVALAPPLAIVFAWLAWLPASLLVTVVHAFGSAPGAAVSTARPPPPVSLALAVLLLGYGLLQQPELRSILTTSAARRGSAGSA